MAFLKVAEVAEELRVTRACVYGFVARGVLPAVRIGRCVRVDETVLKAFINAGRRREAAGRGSGEPA